MDGITLYQSVLTAVGSFRFLRWMAVSDMDGITLYQSVLTAVGSFRVLMGGFTETVGITAYQSVITAVGSFRFLRWMASLSIKVS